MKTESGKRYLTLLLAGAIAAFTPQWTMASTAPCTPINNTATVAYRVGTVDQTPKDSNTASFNVGVKVIVSVTNNDGNEVTVIPGTGKYALKFTVKNDGNAVQDYDLTAEAAATTTVSPYGGNNDSFNGTTIAIYPDVNGDGNFVWADDGGAAITKLDNVAADGGTKVAFVVYSPTDLQEDNLETAVYNLMATSKWMDDSAITFGNVTPTAAQAGGACGGISVDVVAGDGGGTATGDGSKDGKHSDDGAFEVASATIGVTKGYSVVSDPINGVTTPKAIPGAVVRYSVAIANTGGASAVLSNISDALAATLQIISTAGNATWAVPASTRATKNGTLTADTADANADGLGHSNTGAVAGTLTATLATILAADGANGYAAGELKTGETLTITFDATVQ